MRLCLCVVLTHVDIVGEDALCVSISVHHYMLLSLSLSVCRTYTHIHSLGSVMASSSPSSSSPGLVPVAIPPGVDPLYYSLYLLRTRQYTEAIQVTSQYSSHSVHATPAAANHIRHREGHEETDGPSTHAGVTVIPPSDHPQLPPQQKQQHQRQVLDEQAWFIKTKALILSNWINDVEVEAAATDVGEDDRLISQSSSHQNPHTSLRTGTRGGGQKSQRQRGASSLAPTSGRPISSRFGFVRPGSAACSRPGQVMPGSQHHPSQQHLRGGTAASRRAMPITGRLMRLGTASLQSVPGGPHIILERINIEKCARERPMVAKLLCDYFLYVEHRPRMAAELCHAMLKVGTDLPPANTAAGSSAGTSGAAADSNTSSSNAVQPQVGITAKMDWWWAARLGKANYQLGVLREAEKWFKASLALGGPSATAVMLPGNQHQLHLHLHATTVLELAKVYLSTDQPLTAMDLYLSVLKQNPYESVVRLCVARLQDELHNPQEAFEAFCEVVKYDSANLEALSCIAAFYFYEKNQPEVSLRLYRRLLQMGVEKAEIWSDMALSAYFTAQYDFALGCFDRALRVAEEDTVRADVWFNISHVGIALADFGFAERALRIAVALDPTHAEAINNMAVLVLARTEQQQQQGAEVDEEVLRSNRAEAKALLATCRPVAPYLEEVLYNSSVIAYQDGQLEEAQSFLQQLFEVDPDHSDGLVLMKALRNALKM